MRSVKRECLCQIQSRSATLDAEFNSPVAGSWKLNRTAWVGIIQKKGSERNAGGSVESTAKVTIIGDFYDLDGVTSAMRVVHDPLGTFDDSTGARYSFFDIESVNPDRVGRGETTIDAMQIDKDAAE